MLILGLSGGLDAIDENRYNFPFDQIHDSAAVVMRDGHVVAGIEQERLNRIKHTNKAASDAIRLGLAQARASVRDLHAVAYYATEEYCARVLRMAHLFNPAVPDLVSPRAMVQRIVRDATGQDIDARKVRFVGHHWAHAVSAYHMSGQTSALVITIDGQGEGVSGMVFDGRGPALHLLRTIPEADSLGFLYRDVIRFLGYETFDEYKVMGMAPYGDPSRFRPVFAMLYDLLPAGEYRLHLDRVYGLYDYVRPRRRGEAFTQAHSDLAAALQETLETIALHLITHFQRATGHRALCLAGGVAHNCSLNGRLLYSSLFDHVFVQPAAHDAGCALGAALAVHLNESTRPAAALVHVYWGSDIGSPDATAKELAAWKDFVTFERRADVCEDVADLLARRQVVGWVQGRSEFGPRALGNRSILADPRPAEHKDIINRMVKKREAYRPFAPSVIEERAGEFFVLPPGQKTLPYMSVVVEVQPEMRELLGAITHVDGTARVQTVSRSTNERYWRVIEAFGRRTGVPMVLNTSFNNHAEPIVDSVRDAIVCFLTTGLHALAIGDYLVTRREPSPTALECLRVALAAPAMLVAAAGPGAASQRIHHEVRFTYHHGKSASISAQLYAALQGADGQITWADLLDRQSAYDEATRTALTHELAELWSSRLVVLTPGEPAGD
ncbi:MAG: carbamoyltransferase C-terminal domain-containing protein [Acidobacteriota bacterium]